MGTTSLLLVVYLAYVVKHDLALSQIPIIKRWVK
jgi:hypothetical protein